MCNLDWPRGIRLNVLESRKSTVGTDRISGLKISNLPHSFLSDLGQFT